jgi:hypothetical protein
MEKCHETFFSGDEFTPGSQLQTRITPRIFQKIQNPSVGVSNGARKSCLMKKNIVKKSCDTAPLIQIFILNTNRDNIVIHTEFNIMSHSALYYSGCFLPFNIMSH